MTGKPPKSASVTAEAGKLPALRVRPFWPFQVVASGLWEEELVKEMGSGRMAAGLGPHSAHQAVCLVATSAWRKGSLFLSNTKRALWARPGSSREGGDCAGVQGAVGKRKDPQDQHSRSWRKTKGLGVKKAGRTPPLGMLRGHKVITCPQ